MENEIKHIWMESRIIDDWKSREIRNSADLDAVVNGKAISLAYHTNKLEYAEVTFHDTREVFEHGRVEGYSGDTRTLFAIQDARNAWDLFLDSFDKRTLLDEKLVKSFHKELTIGTYDERRYRHGERPGEYKIGDYVTGRYEVGAAPEDVADEIDELLEELTDIPQDKVMIAAAYFHAKFENIHGFADGNGRTGRLLMNYFLVMNDHPVIIIHEEDRRGYMNALERWDREQKLEPLIDFLKEQMVKTWGII